jgi:hypothetical protein
MADYSQETRDAARDLLAAGAVVTLSWSIATAYDPANPSAPPSAPVAVQAAGVTLAYNLKQLGTQPDSLIRAGDKQLLLAALDVTGAALPEPPPDAQVTLADGSVWLVKNPQPLAPAGVPIMYDITIRRP